MNANNFVEMFGNKNKNNNNNQNIRIRYAKVDPNYNGSGRPSLIFDGEDTPTVKKFLFLSSYLPKPNDRVAVMDSFILGKVGDVYEGDDSLDGSYYTKTEIDSLLNNKNALFVKDTRNVVPNVSDFSKNVTFEFKSTSSIGLSISAPFAGVLTFAPWSDDSGGRNHQLAFAADGTLHHRSGSRSGGWGTWSKII